MAKSRLRLKRKSHLWARDPLDFYIEPCWISDRLFEVEKFDGGIWDPACGTGRIVVAAQLAGLHAIASDIKDRSPPGGCLTRDFLACQHGLAPNIVCNPPFKVADKFVEHALHLTTRKVAMVLPISWINGAKRSAWLETTPLRKVVVLAPRPSMPPGAVIAAGGRVGGGTQDYAWYVWLRGYDGRPEIAWLRRDPGPHALKAPPALDRTIRDAADAPVPSQAAEA